MDPVTNSLRFLDNIPRSVSPAVFSKVERKKHKRQRGLWADRQRKEKGRDEEKISRGTVTPVKGSPLRNGRVFQVLV